MVFRSQHENAKDEIEPFSHDHVHTMINLCYHLSEDLSLVDRSVSMGHILVTRDPEGQTSKDPEFSSPIYSWAMQVDSAISANTFLTLL